MKLIKLDSLKMIACSIVLIEILVTIVFKFILQINIEFLVYIIIVVNAALLIYFFFRTDYEKKKSDIEITRILGTQGKEALNYGDVGIIVYDENYIVTWVSDFLLDRGFDIMNEKITKAIEGIVPLFTENNTSVVLQFEDKKYEFTHGEEDEVVFVKDITELYDIKESYNDEKLVLGLINFDNYDETIQIEDEKKIAAINTGIRQTVISWIMGYNAVVRKVRSDRFLVICNLKDFKNMLSSKFNVLETVKKEAKRLDVDITTSMSFAYGSSDVEQLDSTINSMMELALSRGGDQVVVKPIDQEVEYYGSSSEASEKTSKVKARVMAKGIAGLIKECSKVLIIPHRNADLDALGACLAMDKIIHVNKKDSYIIFNDIVVEPKTKEIYDNNFLDLIQDHIFFSPQEALGVLDDDTLIIVLDHHTIDLTAAKEVVEKGKKIVIVDHHRRMNEANIPALMIYNEPSASSTVELVSEMAQYQKKEVEFSSLDASIMYAGLLVDTDQLRVRCLTRTFEVCAYLRKIGADIALANEWLKEDVNEFVLKANISKGMEIVGENLALSVIEETVSRTALAKGAVALTSVKGIDASFVIGRLDKDTCGISARSNGKINVQIIMEKMGGGGHFGAAALQKKDCTVADLKKELLNVLKEYHQGESEDESNSTN